MFILGLFTLIFLGVIFYIILKIGVVHFSILCKNQRSVGSSKLSVESFTKTFTFSNAEPA